MFFFILFYMKRFAFTLLTTLLVSAISASAKSESSNKSKDLLSISGYLQALYNWEYAGGETEDSSFRIRRARVSFAGKIIDNERVGRIDYRLQLDFAENPKIVDAWVRYRPFTQLGIEVGQFKIPLSIENSEYAPLKLEFIDYSLVVQRLVRMSSNDVSGISSTGRDCGAQLYGGFFKREGFNIINYNLAIFNGNGINAKKDSNKSKDFVGRITLQPIKELSVAGYYQYGEGNFGDNKYVDYQRYGGGVAYDSSSYFARSEYIRGDTGALISEGAYIAAGWKFRTAKSGDGLVGARFDYFDSDIHDSSCEIHYTLGAAYQPWRYLRLQLNYTLKQHQHLGKPITHAISVMVSGIF